MKKHVTILQVATLPEDAERALRDVFTVVARPSDKAEAERMLHERGSTFRGIASRGMARLTVGELALLPNLEIIASYSAGMDGIDLDAARERGIVIRNGSAAVAGDVADLAVGHAIAAVRETVRGRDVIRDGVWEAGSFSRTPSMRGLKVGIVGFGSIGSEAAKRLDPMGCEVAYHGPRDKAVGYRYFADIADLARWAELLMVTCPALPETRHLVDRRVLRALGPGGYVVNVSRGVVIDEAAMIEALQSGDLRGAALDVFENEPHVPQALRDNPNVVLSPHVGGATHGAHERMREAFIAALVGHFEKQAGS